MVMVAGMMMVTVKGIVMHLVLAMPVTSIFAAYSGAAVAGGMELALWYHGPQSMCFQRRDAVDCRCDLRVMERSSYMGVYCRRALDGGGGDDGADNGGGVGGGMWWYWWRQQQLWWCLLGLQEVWGPAD
jgi:hypothetical protein